MPKSLDFQALGFTRSIVKATGPPPYHPADLLKLYLNRKAFKGVLREFNMLCHRLELFGAELVAIGGSKFKASNSQRREMIGHGDFWRRGLERVQPQRAGV